MTTTTESDVSAYRQAVAASGDRAEQAAIEGMPDEFVAALLAGDPEAAAEILR